MKVTKNKKNNINIELDQFEASVLATIIGRVRHRHSDGSVFLWDLFRKLSDLEVNYFNQVKTWYGDDFLNKNMIDIMIDRPKTKKDCSFFYPKEGYRHDYISDISKFEARKLKEAYIDGNYICGIDGTFKKFSLNLVKHLNWAD